MLGRRSIESAHGRAGEGNMPAASAARRPSRFARGLNWATQGFLALADQALFSGANFLVSVLLARWLQPAEYGVYSLAYAVFLLFATAHTAVVGEPMTVFGSGKYIASFPTYLQRVLWGHLALMIPVNVLLFGAAFVLGRLYSSEVRHAFLGLVLGSAAILLFWLVRRVFYVFLQPARGVIASGIYFIVLLSSLVLLQFAHRVSTLMVFIAMAFASLVASVITVIPYLPARGARRAEPSFVEMSRAHWQYGRWALATAIIQWFPGQVYFALLPAWLGLEEAAGLRALMNFPMPVLQGIAALSSLLLPLLVRDLNRGGAGRMNRTMLVFLGLFVGGASLYGVILWVFHDQAFHLFYGGKYSKYAGLPLLLAGLMPATTCMNTVLSNGLRALSRPDRIFWSYLGSFLAAVAVGIPLAARFGISGALLGLHVSGAVATLIMVWFYVRSLPSTVDAREGSEAALAC